MTWWIEIIAGAAGVAALCLAVVYFILDDNWLRVGAGPTFGILPLIMLWLTSRRHAHK